MLFSPSPTRLLAGCSALTLALVLTGCSVKPIPLTTEAVHERVAADQQRMYRDQEPVHGSISLEEAMARALKYNLDYRLKLMESALSAGLSDLAGYEMLPSLMASAGYISRNNDSGGNSVNIETGAVSLASSTSQERDRGIASAEFSWNILDLGVGYYRARQQANQYLVAEENRRRVMQTILQDVRSAYWRAVGAQRLSRQADAIDTKVRTALKRSQAAESQGLVPPKEALTYQRLMLDAAALINTRRQELDLAKAELAALMNLPPTAQFTLVEAEERALPTVSADAATLEELALTRRPELRQEEYQARISADEARRQLLTLLPGIGLVVGSHTDSNAYLYNASWVESSAQVSWNLLRLLALPDMLKAQTSQENVDQARRLALSMAVLTQVRVAVGRYALAQQNLAIARDSNAVDQRMLSYARAGAETRTDTGLELIRAEVRALHSGYQRAGAYAAAQAAMSRLNNSIGLDTLPKSSIEQLSLAELGQQIKNRLVQPAAEVYAYEAAPVRPPSLVHLQLPAPRGVAGVNRAQLSQIVTNALRHHQIGLLKPNQPGPGLQMQLRMQPAVDGVCRASWRLTALGSDGQVTAQRTYASSLPKEWDRQLLTAFTEAAVVANLNILEDLDDAASAK